MTLEIGKTAIVQGLQSQPTLNGKRGLVTAFDDEKQRYVVFVDGAYKALKEANLKVDVESSKPTASSGSTTSPSADDQKKDHVSAARQRYQAQQAQEQRQQQNAQRQQQQQQHTPGVGNTGDTFSNYLEMGKRRGLEYYNKIKFWCMNEGLAMWQNGPAPKIVMLLFAVMFLYYYMANDARYARNDGKQKIKTNYNENKYNDDYKRVNDAPNDYDRRVYNDNDDYEEKYRKQERDDDRYNRRQAQRDDDYERQAYQDDRYDSHRGDHSGRRQASSGSSGFSTGMYVMLAFAAYQAYQRGYFERLRGMNIFQMYFLWQIAQSFLNAGRGNFRRR